MQQKKYFFRENNTGIISMAGWKGYKY